MHNIREYTDLRGVLKNKVKSKLQQNKLFEADCEILKLGPKRFLATSIDSLSDEIQLGLYQNVETWAWISVMASVSDLAASGTKPLGLTLSTQWKHETSDVEKVRFFQGLHLACKKAKVPLLGGDSGLAASHVFTSSIVGESSSMPLTRKAQAGDLLVLSQKKNTGIGPALAFRFLLGAPSDLLPENLFRPLPSWETTFKLKHMLRGAIDTSDGIASSVSILCDLNKLGIDLFWTPEINSPVATKAVTALGLSEVFLWLGDHGDFQTMYVVPEKFRDLILKQKTLKIIGQFKRKKGTRFHYRGQEMDLPVEKITSCERSLDAYKQLVMEFNNYLKPFR